MARNEQLIRQLKLLQLLEASRYGRRLDELRDDLIEDMGLSTLSDRTVRRDLEALQAAGFDVDAHEEQRGVVWKLGPKLRGIPKLEASATELVALSMVRDLLVPLSGTIYGQGLETLWQKMQDSLPEPVWKHFDKLRKNVLIRGTPTKTYAEQQGVIATLNRAISQHRVVSLEYQSRDQQHPKARDVEPYQLAYYNGSLYLVAEACDAVAGDSMRHYKIDRCHKATALDKHFKPRADFDPQAHFKGSMGVYKAAKAERFVIRISSDLVPWLRETPWHSEQQIIPEEHGTSQLVIPSAYQEEMLPKILGLSDHAEILEPPSAREEMLRIISSLHGRYGPS